MALAASHTNYKFYIYATVKETDYANNRSKVELKFTIKETYGLSSDPAPVLWFDVRANGSYIVGNKDHGIKVTCKKMSANKSEQTLYLYTVWAPHNSYGDCKLTVTTELVTDTDQIWRFTGSASFTLPNIPRTSTFTLDKNSVYVGSSIKISIDRKVASFTHKIYYGMSGQGYSLVESSVGTTYTHTIPTTAINYIEGKSGTGWIKVETYNGKTLIGTKSQSFTVTIPATSISATKSVVAGNSATINAPSISTAVSHKIYATYPGQKQEYVTGGTGKSFTLKTELTALNYIPASESGTIQVVCKSYHDQTYLGESKASVTYTAGNDIVPEITSVTINEAVEKVKTAFNQFTKKLSQLNVDVTANGVYGSKIVSYSTKVDGVNYNQSAFTTNQLQTAGSMTITTTVKDSRGRTTTHTETITVADYFSPNLSEINVCNVDSAGKVTPGGPILAIKVRGRIAPVNDSNKGKLVVEYRKLTEQTYTVFKTVNFVTLFGFDGIVAFPDLPKDDSYEFVVTLNDKISEVEKSAENGVTVISLLAGGRGVCFFGTATEEGIWVGNQKIYDAPPLPLKN